MTADVLVYARGGGHGHAMRGAIVQQLLREHGRRVTLLVTEESARHLPADPDRVHTLDDALARGAATLVVDTFPRGWQRELDGPLLARFSRRVLVARLNRDARLPAESEAYDTVLSPYPPELDEWDVPLARASHTGWLVRPAPMRVVPEGRDFVVLDPGARVPASLLERLSSFATRVGLRLVHLRAMTDTCRAHKLLSIGAGYHTVYELASTRADVRFFPLARRWDDQAHRAARVQRSTSTLAAVLEWLRAPMETAPFCAAPQAAQLGPAFP